MHPRRNMKNTKLTVFGKSLSNADVSDALQHTLTTRHTQQTRFRFRIVRQSVALIISQLQENRVVGVKFISSFFGR